MGIARVKIDSTGAGTSSVEINGENVAHALVGYDISDRVGGVPNVTLHLLGTGSVELAQADVQLRPVVVEALIALGWLPPERVSLLRTLANNGWPETTYEAESLGVMVSWLLDGGTYDPATGETAPPTPEPAPGG